MTDSPLTEWARLEVQKMIDATIERYDIKQDARHRENAIKLDRQAENLNSLKDSMGTQFGQLKKIMDESSGGRKLIAWGIPLFVAILTVIAEILRH